MGAIPKPDTAGEGSLDSTLAGGSQFNSKHMAEIRNSRWSADTTRATLSSSSEESPSIRRLPYRMTVLKFKECVPFGGAQTFTICQCQFQP